MKIKGVLLMALLCGVVMVAFLITLLIIGFVINFAIQATMEFVAGDMIGGVKLIVLFIIIGVLLYWDTSY